MVVKFPSNDTVIHSVSEEYEWPKRCLFDYMVGSLVLFSFHLFLKGRHYTFDRVFKPQATQEKVYNEAAQVIVQGRDV